MLVEVLECDGVKLLVWNWEENGYTLKFIYSYQKLIFSLHAVWELSYLLFRFFQKTENSCSLSAAYTTDEIDEKTKALRASANYNIEDDASAVNVSMICHSVVLLWIAHTNYVFFFLAELSWWFYLVFRTNQLTKSYNEKYLVSLSIFSKKKGKV